MMVLGVVGAIFAGGNMALIGKKDCEPISTTNRELS
jgi:hypothetical protein